MSDLDYLDEANEPKVLPLRDADISFETLVVRYSGGITARAILDEMLRTGAAEKVDKDHVKLIHHAFVPHGDDAEKLKIFLKHASDLLSNHRVFSGRSRMWTCLKVWLKNLRSSVTRCRRS